MYSKLTHLNQKRLLKHLRSKQGNLKATCDKLQLHASTVKRLAHGLEAKKENTEIVQKFIDELCVGSLVSNQQ